MSVSYFRILLIVSTAATLFSSKSMAQDNHAEKSVEVTLRMIGHKVLLHIGDSTSIVSPIVKEDGHYKVQFDTEFSFLPDDLVEIVNRETEQTAMSQGFIMEVEKCESGEVVYSYETTQDTTITPCKLREQPKACYNLLFTLNNTPGLSAVLYTARESSNSSESSNGMMYLLILFTLLLVIVIIVVWRGRRKPKLDPNLIQLGQYHFDKRKAELILSERKIELTSKESDLLSLLYDSVNSTVERELILSEVWGDEGDYVGRTLDVFISKLRKKLEADPEVKIVNVRGVGYKLLLD